MKRQKPPGMTEPQKALLLAMARILKAVLADLAAGNPRAWEADLGTLEACLRPFDGFRRREGEE